MHTQRKIALITLAAALSVPAALAQDTDQGPAPAPSTAPARMHRQMGARGWNDRGEMGSGRGRRFGMGMNRWGRQDLMLVRIVREPAMRERLGITADQAAKIEQETLDFRKTQIQDRASVQVKRVELASLLSAEQPDRAAIDQKLGDIGAARLAQEKAAIDFHLTMREALTPDQRQKLQQMRESFRRGGRTGGPRGMGHQRHMEDQRGPKGAPPPPSPDPDGN
jgi:Spy/CpxP family protein refolding chaperone